MLQQPVAPELRSFRSLSRFANNKSFRRQSNAARRTSQLSPPPPSTIDYTPTPSDRQLLSISLSADNTSSGKARKTVSLSVDDTAHVSPWSDDNDGGTTAYLSVVDDDDVPYPGYADIVFRCLNQTSRPRSYCLRMVTNQ